MVLFLFPEWEGPAFQEAATYVQYDQFLLNQVQKVLERFEHDIYLSDGGFLVSVMDLNLFSLDDTVERNCDYLVAINFFTAYLL